MPKPVSSRSAGKFWWWQLSAWLMSIDTNLCLCLIWHKKFDGRSPPFCEMRFFVFAVNFCSGNNKKAINLARACIHCNSVAVHFRRLFLPLDIAKRGGGGRHRGQPIYVDDSIAPIRGSFRAFSISTHSPWLHAFTCVERTSARLMFVNVPMT